MSNYMFKLSYGLFVLSVNCHKRDNACIINTGIQVASNPTRISIAVSKSDFTNEMLNYTDDFTLSVISQDADFALFKRFGFQSGRDVEKFVNFEDVKRVDNGCLAVLKGTNSYISAHVDQRIDLGTHTLIIATVTDGEVLSTVPSVTYEYYQERIKPKPQNKPNGNGKTVWRCRICGYEYVGDDMNDDFICPTCKHGKSDFEKVI